MDRANVVKLTNTWVTTGLPYGYVVYKTETDAWNAVEQYAHFCMAIYFKAKENRAKTPLIEKTEGGYALTACVDHGLNIATLAWAKTLPELKTEYYRQHDRIIKLFER